MFRWILLLLPLLIGTLGAPAGLHAQVPAAPAAAEPAASPQEIDRLLSTLDDPERRAELAAQLRALKAAAAKTVPEEDTMGARVLSVLSDRIERFSEEIASAGRAMADTPRAWKWLNRQVGDPDLRERWLRLALELAVTIAAGYAARLLLGLALRRPRRHLTQRQPPGWTAKLPLLLGVTLVDAIPIIAFAAAAFGALAFTAPPKEVRVAALTFVNASVLLQLVMLATRGVLAPGAPGLRLPDLSDESAEYGIIWVRRIGFTALYGYFVAQAARLLGLPFKSYEALLKVVGLAVAAMLVIVILQNRATVAAWLRGTPLSGPPTPDADEIAAGQHDRLVAEIAGETPPELPPAREKPGPLRAVRRGLADVWHVLAILYLAVLFGVWALAIKGGFEYVARATVLSVLVLVAARLLALGIDRLIRRAFAVSPELRQRHPLLEPRANRYLPILHRALKALLWLVAFLALLNAWGVDSLAWVEKPIGQRVVQSAVSIAVIIILVLIAWEVVSGAIERYLSHTDRAGQQIERSARARTLLPLARNAFMIVLVTLVALTTLSELGLDIAPLLGGVGVIGLAIGFGAQTLVKDVITGLFILLEDTIVIGDVVDVGGGHAGVVEAISIRSLRLRDGAGAVHSVPFSAVSSITNMTKDFSFAVFDVQVSYTEDPERVIAALRSVGETLQQDPVLGANILAPLEIMGVDQFRDSYLLVKARFKTRPGRQWTVQRSFNAAMKREFERQGVEVPFARNTMHIVHHNEPPPSVAPASAAQSDTSSKSNG